MSRDHVGELSMLPAISPPLLDRDHLMSSGFTVAAGSAETRARCSKSHHSSLSETTSLFP